MKNSANILIAKITSAHGIKGEVNIVSFAQEPKNIENYQKIFDKKGSDFQIKIIGDAKGKNHDIFIAKIKDINDRNAAEALRDTELFISRDQLSNTEEGEFYYVDLIGLEVLDMQENKIGKVLNVGDFGGGGIVEIEFDKASNNQEKIQIFPFNDDTVPEVNIGEGYLKLDIPEVIEV